MNEYPKLCSPAIILRFAFNLKITFKIFENFRYIFLFHFLASGKLHVKQPWAYKFNWKKFFTFPKIAENWNCRFLYTSAEKLIFYYELKIMSPECLSHSVNQLS